MKIALGSDEKSGLTDSVIAAVQGRGHETQLYGALVADTPWATAARQVAEAVADGTADEGILFCWTGTGVALAANKVPDIRAALCADAETARGARLWNNANVLCLSIRLTTPTVAQEILAQWFGTHYVPNPEDNACLAVVAAIEAEYAAGG